MDRRACVVRAAKRFCRIAYRMVAGGQVFHHPSAGNGTTSWKS
ncbi:MAG: hypothetical protein ACLQGP_36625 [Isosphaeraceae bacterium]